MNSADCENNVCAFLEKYGSSLSAYGSAELGLCRTDAIAFLELLKNASRLPLGIEVWRRRGGKFFIDSLSGWYSEGEDISENIESAKVFLSETSLSDSDLVTVQFG